MTGTTWKRLAVAWTVYGIGAGVFALALALGAGTLAAMNLLEVDYQKLVSRADLHYAEPATRSEEGLPVGNGRMGSLVWTTPGAVRLQINRVDVFATPCSSESFPERHKDYCGGCGLVDVEFVDSGRAVFPSGGTAQRLGCYDGLATVEGAGVKTRSLAWNEQDVMAVEVSDGRARPGIVKVNLRMLRGREVKTARHTARSRLERRNGAIILAQEFMEGDYFCGSAVAIRVVGREAEEGPAKEGELGLLVAPGRGTFTVLIASAASFHPREDLVARALAQLEAAMRKSFAGMLESNRAWWGGFWAKSFVHLHSADGIADELERAYTYYLYLMAATSRGKYPTKFNGMLWTTGGDRRQWGSQFWGANQSCLYNNALLAANHGELLDPMFDMYSAMLASCGVAARQQWGSQGAFIPETVGFDGLAPLPEDIAAEMRDLYLLRKPWEERSNRFREYAGTRMPHSSRWNWIQSGRWENGRWAYQEREGAPFGPVTHIFARGAKIAYQYWLRYEYTQEQRWLRERAYPVLKNVAEFYRNFPNMRKGEDGQYHIHDVNSNESVRGAQDTDEEIASMRGIFPVLIQASQVLQVDAELRPAWQEFLAKLAPLPRSDDPRAQAPAGTNRGPVWIRGLPPVVSGNPSGRPDGNTMPIWFFDLCTLESDVETLKVGQATFNGYASPETAAGRRVGVLSKVPLVAAILGRADAVRSLLPSQIRGGESPVLANRMDLREGPQTTSAQRLGNAADALHTALCYDLPAGPGQSAVIHVFAAWPKDWEAEYRLLCRGGFLVSSAMHHGQVEFVEIQAQRGGECRLRNPWGEGEVDLYRDDRMAGNASGSLLRLGTGRGETIVVVQAGKRPQQFKRSTPGD